MFIYEHQFSTTYILATIKAAIINIFKLTMDNLTTCIWNVLFVERNPGVIIQLCMFKHIMWFILPAHNILVIEDRTTIRQNKIILFWNPEAIFGYSHYKQLMCILHTLYTTTINTLLLKLHYFNTPSTTYKTTASSWNKTKAGKNNVNTFTYNTSALEAPFVALYNIY